MTEKEWLSVCKTLSAFYPSIKSFDTPESVNLWYQVLKDIDFKVMQHSVINWVKNESRIPTVADLREYARKSQDENPEEWGQAWEHVLKLIGVYGYYGQEKAVSEMTERERETVKMLGYNNLCHSTNLQIDRASFRDIYTRQADRDKEKARITAGAYLPKKEAEPPKLETKAETVKELATDAEIDKALEKIKLLYIQGKKM